MTKQTLLALAFVMVCFRPAHAFFISFIEPPGDVGNVAVGTDIPDQIITTGLETAAVTVSSPLELSALGVVTTVRIFESESDVLSDVVIVGRGPANPRCPVVFCVSFFSDPALPPLPPTPPDQVLLRETGDLQRVFGPLDLLPSGIIPGGPFVLEVFVQSDVEVSSPRALLLLAIGVAIVASVRLHARHRTDS
jgi:hypothetical protein